MQCDAVAAAFGNRAFCILQFYGEGLGAGDTGCAAGGFRIVSFSSYLGDEIPVSDKFCTAVCIVGNRRDNICGKLAGREKEKCIRDGLVCFCYLRFL